MWLVPCYRSVVEDLDVSVQSNGSVSSGWGTELGVSSTGQSFDLVSDDASFHLMVVVLFRYKGSILASQQLVADHVLVGTRNQRLYDLFRSVERSIETEHQQQPGGHSDEAD